MPWEEAVPKWCVISGTATQTISPSVHGASCSLAGDEGGGEQWPWGQWGLFRAALLLGRGQPHAALGGDLWLSPALSCQTSGRFGVPLRRARAPWDVQGLLKVAAKRFVKRKSVNAPMVKSEQPLQRNHLLVLSWSLWGAGEGCMGGGSRARLRREQRVPCTHPRLLCQCRYLHMHALQRHRGGSSMT